jgi:sigma-E factor negative regulatory protein RseB
LPLKSLLLNDKGQLLERYQFTTLATTPPDDSQLSPAGQCRAVARGEAEVEQGSVTQAWHSDWLPSGFEQVSSTVHRDPRTKAEVTSLLYDDGLTRFSVFIEPLQGAAVPDARVQLGPTAAVTRHLSTPQGDMMATVVGEIPMGTAERIALSMRVGKDDAQAKP